MKRWFSSAELAAMRLNGLPITNRGIHALAKRENWADAHYGNKPLARVRRKRGGGTEYHINVLPLAAQRAFFEIEKANAQWFWRWSYKIFSLRITLDIQKGEGRS